MEHYKFCLEYFPYIFAIIHFPFFAVLLPVKFMFLLALFSRPFYFKYGLYQAKKNQEVEFSKILNW